MDLSFQEEKLFENPIVGCRDNDKKAVPFFLGHPVNLNMLNSLKHSKGIKRHYIFSSLGVKGLPASPPPARFPQPPHPRHRVLHQRARREQPVHLPPPSGVWRRRTNADVPSFWPCDQF